MNEDSNIFASYVSELFPTDKKLLHQTILRWRPNSKNYEDSWGYVIQATRYGGFKWYDPHTGYLIFFGRKSNTDPTLVIPTFAATPAYLARTIKIVQYTLQAPKTVLKNINIKDASRFINHGFRPYFIDERWNDISRYDDQTFPQLLVNLKNIVDLKGKGYRYLRKALRKDPHAYIRPYQESDKEAVLAIFTSKDIIKKADDMYYESHIMYPSSDVDKFVILHDVTNEILGFIALSPITSKAISSVASLFKPNVEAASIWGAYQTLITMYRKGYTKVNFGGNETEGSYNFIRRIFRPVEEIKKTHLVYTELA
jgi:hypothetical protein